MGTVAVIIPWRDSGDARRQRNLAYVRAYYQKLDMGPVILSGDGKEDGHFNRQAAYNRGLTQTSADTILWNEADTLIPLPQIMSAAQMAQSRPGLVIPYTERHELSPAQTGRVLQNLADPFDEPGEDRIFKHGTSIGQAGVTTRHTIELIGGWDENFQGWGYDDNAMLHVFSELAGKTRFVDGWGVHLWHPPAYRKPSKEAAQQTRRNAERNRAMQRLHGEQLRRFLIGES